MKKRSIRKRWYHTVNGRLVVLGEGRNSIHSVLLHDNAQEDVVHLGGGIDDPRRCRIGIFQQDHVGEFFVQIDSRDAGGLRFQGIEQDLARH